MRKLLALAGFTLFLCSCDSSNDIKSVEWLIGSWEGTDVNTLVFHENWERGTNDALIGYGSTVKPDGDTLFHETLKIDYVEGAPFYFATLPKSKEPVLFKMIQGDATHAIFENKDHDFPERISYTLETASTMKVKLEGIEDGVPKIETLEFSRSSDTHIHIQTDTMMFQDTTPVIHIQ